MPSGTQQQARVTTEDKSLAWKVPADQIGRRFADKETKVAFFTARVDEASGILEIGDRVTDEKW